MMKPDQPNQANNTTPPSPPPVVPATPVVSQDGTRATLALVFGILSCLCCGFILGIPAILLGRTELQAIEQGRSHEANLTTAKIGYILGIIGTSLSVLLGLFFSLFDIFYLFIMFIATAL